jgi:hypothetical protein
MTWDEAVEMDREHGGDLSADSVGGEETSG